MCTVGNVLRGLAGCLSCGLIARCPGHRYNKRLAFMSISFILTRKRGLGLTPRRVASACLFNSAGDGSTQSNFPPRNIQLTVIWLQPLRFSVGVLQPAKRKVYLFKTLRQFIQIYNRLLIQTWAVVPSACFHQSVQFKLPITGV